MSTIENALHRVISFLFIVIAILTIASVSALATDVDTTFNAVPSNPLASPTSLRQIVQPDGKVIVWGIKGVADGVAKGDVFRLKSDGSLDTSFHYCSCALSSVTGVMLMADGRMIVSGSQASNAKMIRLNPDGSIDSSFAAMVAGPPSWIGGATFIVEAVQPDGKVLASLRVSSMGFVNFTLQRYNADGSQDTGFTNINYAAGSPMSAFVRIALLSDGRFYFAVTSGVSGTFASLRRMNANGSADPTWDVPAFSSPGFPSLVNIAEIAVATDGSVLAAGSWETVNGVEKRHLVKLQPAGNVDLAFNPPSVMRGSGVHILSDGKILFSARTDIFGTQRIYRLMTDGTPDNTYEMDPAVTSIINAWVTDSNDRVIFAGTTASGVELIRLSPSGTRDTGFNPAIGTYGRVYSIVTQSDGKVLMAGVFTRMNGVARTSFARVNADGSLDTTFNPGTGFANNPPSAMVLQPDGKIIAVGQFSSYNGTSVSGLVRINTDGSIDNSFAVSVSSFPKAIALQSDGKIIIAGNFATVNGTARTGIARLDPVDGSLDNTFNPVIGSPSLRAVLVQPDGKVLLGGSFSGVNGFNRANLARLSSDGTLDQTFLATGASTTTGIFRQGDGKYVLLTQGDPATAISRRNVDGSPDTGFTAPSFSSSTSSDLSLDSIVLQPDRSIVVGGRFDTVGAHARSNITRLASNGSLDLLFMPSGADGRVRTLAPYATGKVMAGGDSTVIANVSRAGNARLNVSPLRAETPFDFDGDGRADFSVYRPSSGVWYELFSNGSGYTAPTFGLAGDIPAPGDFDGDGITDEAVFRPSSGDWWYLSSAHGGQVNYRYGLAGDIPRPGDFDGDGKTDFILYRPSTQVWYRAGSQVGQTFGFGFGLPGDQPLSGDFDGDGKSDMAIFRPSTGDWWYAASSAGNAFRSVHWGATGDIPVPADYDGDGKTDFAVFRPSNGAWYVTRSTDQSYVITTFGLEGDRPVAADYDGDGSADIALFRPSTGVWYVLQSSSGTVGVQWGLATDVAIPNAFLP